VLAADLKTRYPRLRLFLSTTTIAGQQVARQNLSNVDAVFYFPFDWTFIVRRTSPRCGRGLPDDGDRDLAEPPARVPPPRDQNGDQRPHLGAFLPALPPDPAVLRRVLADVDRFCVQSEESARRLVDLGADAARVSVTGSRSSIRSSCRRRPRTAGRASACALLPALAEPHRDRRRQHAARREAAVLHAFARIKTSMPGALAVLAPRQPDRFGEVERLSREAGFVTLRRSALPIDAEPRADVVVLDTIGELAQLYQLATAAFVGGSLVDHGGHNILEPAVFGKPIVFGPYMQNFKEIAEAFLSNDAAVQVQSERELDDVLLALVTDPVRRARLGAAARALVAANRGAKAKTLDVIGALLPSGDAPGRAVVRPFRLVH
jgi:3-deoxy-D-manno-octulosonic-acid transferase